MRYPVLNLGRSEVRRAFLLIFRQGTILLIRLSGKGVWDLPGGHVEAGETDLEAALREAREEIGGFPALRIMDTSVLREGNLVWTTYLVQTQDSGWEPTLNWEHDRWGWFSFRELPSPLRPSVEKLLSQEIRIV